MHDHTTCEQLMAAAMRSGNNGRAEYLSTRCDRMHGQLDNPTPDPRAAQARATLREQESSA